MISNSPHSSQLASSGDALVEIRYNISGLDSVHLRCKAGESDLTVNIPQLVLSVLEHLIEKPYLLDGREISFIRKALHLKGTELARVISVEPETISRWENDRCAIGIDKDKFLRCLVLNYLLINSNTLHEKYRRSSTVPYTCSFIDTLSTIGRSPEAADHFKIVIDLELVKALRGPYNLRGLLR